MHQIKKRQLALFISSAIAVSGCANIIKPAADIESNQVDLKKSYLESQTNQVQSPEYRDEALNEKEAEFVRLNNLKDNKRNTTLEIDLSSQFNDKPEFQVSVNELPLNDFLHYMLGELLSVSYLIEPSVKSNVTPITLELKEKVTGKKLFQLVQQVLGQNNINIALNDNIFFIHPINAQGTRSDTAVGYGRNHSDVPDVPGDIFQLLHAKYGASNGLKNITSSLVDAIINTDPLQGLITVKGKRQQVLRALDLIALLDSRLLHDKASAMISFQYIDSQTFIEKVSLLLEEEGVINKSTRTPNTNLQFIPIEHLGKVAVFASADEILDRVEYWANILDKPRKGSEQTFYTYHPRYARASDLGQSLTPLISPQNNRFSLQGNNSGQNTNAGIINGMSSATSNQNNVNVTSQTVEGDNMRMVVDQRSNSLIFYSTGKHYQELQPIIKKLDVMPKQVMLEVVIAEVTLTGSFAKGVEYAIKSGASGSKSENFNFNSKTGFSYSVVGLDGNININLNQTDGLVNVLSRPTLLVRDGVQANISVGDDIPTVGSTTADPDGERETTSIQYRKTGIDLNVTPTVNAQGTVIMTIEQNISNVPADGLNVGGSPAIFERKVSTEVVAGDGQTVMLGGLISETKNNSATSIPGLGSIPLLGHLFRSDSESSSKTELVILVTPKIVHNVNDWQRVQQRFVEGLENIKF